MQVMHKVDTVEELDIQLERSDHLLASRGVGTLKWNMFQQPRVNTLLPREKKKGKLYIK